MALTLGQLKNMLKTFVQPNVYFIIESEDSKSSDRYEVIDVVSDSMIYYKDRWDFEDEVINQITDDYYNLSESQLDKEIQRILKSCKRLSGIFVILSPEIID